MTGFTTFFEKQGPSSYAAGGFVIDLSATYQSLTSLRLQLKKGARGNLGFGRLEYALNDPAPGKVTVRCFKGRYDRVVSEIAEVTNQPDGVSVAAASGQSATPEDFHIHPADHTHPAAPTSVPTAAGGGSELAPLGPDYTGHTHSIALPPKSVDSGSGSSHNHVDDSIYEHNHQEGYAVGDLSEVEIAADTDLSATQWYGRASGARGI